MSTDDDDDPFLLYARAQSVGSEELERMQLRLRARLLVHAKRRARRSTAALALGSVAVLATTAWLFASRSEVPTAERPPSTPNAIENTRIELAHGSWGEVTPDAEIRIEKNDRFGAEIGLLRGSIELSVHRIDGVRWRVRSAGYVVEAIGTRFRVRHTGGEPEVTVERGAVRVMGPTLPPDGKTLRASSAAASSSATSSTQPDPHPPSRGRSDATATRPAPAPDRASEGKERPPLERARLALRRGDSRTMVALLPQDFPTGREGWSAADYLNAGDALRGSGDQTRAEKSYEVACSVSPRSEACGVGLVKRAILRAEAGDRANAVTLLSRYLEHHPQGELASEALGRRMLWNAERETTRDEARRDAAMYLRRWPRGPRAADARRIAGHL